MYLTAIKKTTIDIPNYYVLKIPNREITFAFEEEILNRLKNKSLYTDIQVALFSKDINKFKESLNKFMLQTVSSFDTVNESFYHGMILGICALLNNRYYIKSNRESGLGRFDIALFPKTNQLPAFIFEFKHTNDKDVNLDDLAKKALLHIDLKKYETELKQTTNTEIIKIGIAFMGKNAVISY